MSDRIRVAVRARPLLGAEKETCTNCVHVSEGQVLIGGERTFAFDTAFDQRCESKQVYDVVVRPLIDAFVGGFNATVFAYGQTGAGKTHTMLAVMDAALSDLFVLLDANGGAPSKGRLSATVMEIYNEQLVDLLDVTCSKSVTLRESDRGTTVVGLQAFDVDNLASAREIVAMGTENRRTAATLMNQSSSRSHCIVTLTLTYNGAVSRLNFCDLAGSERIKKSHGFGGVGSSEGAAARVKEGININSGLLVLGNVITALYEKKAHVPFRESKLTRVLQDSLAGNSKTTMIACISSADTNFEESLNTLKYAYRAKALATKPVVNAVTACENVQCAETLEALRRELAEAKAVLSERGIVPHTTVIDASTAAARDFRTKIMTLDEDLARERRINKALQDDLFQAEYSAMCAVERARKLEADNAALQAALAEAATTRSTSAASPPRAASARLTSAASPSGGTATASPDGAAAAAQMETLRQLERERDALLAQKVLNEEALRSITAAPDATSAAHEPSVDDLARSIEEKERLIAELSSRFECAAASLRNYEAKLAAIEEERRRLRDGLRAAEHQLELSAVEQEKKDKQRRELKASFEARLRAAEVTATEFRNRVREAQQNIKAQQAEQERVRRLQAELRLVKEQFIKAKEAARAEAARAGKLRVAHAAEVTSLHRQLRDHEAATARLEKQLARKEAEIAKARQAVAAASGTGATALASIAVNQTSSRLLAEMAAIANIDAEIAELTRERDSIKSLISAAQQPDVAQRIRRSLAGWQIYLLQVHDNIASARAAGDAEREKVFAEELEQTEARIRGLESSMPQACEEQLGRLREVEDRIDSLSASKQFKIKAIRSHTAPSAIGAASPASVPREGSPSAATTVGSPARGSSLPPKSAAQEAEESEVLRLRDALAARDRQIEALSLKVEDQALLLEKLLPSKWSTRK